MYSITNIDHLVITTTDIEACTAFYGALGFEAHNAGDRWELFAGDFKINVHIRGHELEPKARYVTPGSADMCFEIDGDIETCRDTLVDCGLTIELGIVSRHGVRGCMRSVYLRDPDENLVELCSYE